MDYLKFSAGLMLGILLGIVIGVVFACRIRDAILGS